jgi:hypothetical protein
LHKKYFLRIYNTHEMQIIYLLILFTVMTSISGEKENRPVHDHGKPDVTVSARQADPQEPVKPAWSAPDTTDMELELRAIDFSGLMEPWQRS